MALIELVIRLPGELLEPWSDALLESDAVSVAVEDQDVNSPDEVAVYGEPGLPAPAPGWANNRVSVLLPDHIDPEAWLDGIARALDREAPPIIERRVVADQDWVTLTQAQFTPVVVGRLAVVPSWHEIPEGADLVPIRIDPGAAFGTGTHPTTRLCLAWLSAHLRPGMSLLDYGCGSGILSIGAARLGAAPVAGIDIDPQAVRTAIENAAANGVDVRYFGADDGAGLVGRHFDVVVANILAKPLMLLAPGLLAHVADTGSVVLSGILERQAQEVIATYQALQPTWHWSSWASDEGWVAVVGQPGT